MSSTVSLIEEKESHMELGVGVIGFFGHANMALQDWDLLSARGIRVALKGVSPYQPSIIPASWQAQLKLDGGLVYGQWQELVHAPDIDIVVVDGPYQLHATMLLEALHAGKYVFCEKAIALNWEEYYAIEQVIEHGAPFMWAMLSMRYQPMFYTLFKALKQGVIGRVKQLRVQKSYKHGERPDWYNDRDAYGGTALWVGSHAVDLMIGAAGPVQSIQAIHDCGDTQYELLVQAQCLHQNGVLSSLSLDYFQPASATDHSDDRMRVLGTQGVIESSHGQVVLVNQAGEQCLTLQEPPCRTFADGVVALVNGRESLVPTEELLEITKTCLSIRDSADRQGSIQKLVMR